MSVARDCDLGQGDDEKDGEQKKEGGGLQNVDGLYATGPLEAGDVVFTEDDAPDAQLGRSEDPNCEIVDGGGIMAVVATRSIAEGEFFTVLPSDNESDDDDDEMDSD